MKSKTASFKKQQPNTNTKMAKPPISTPHKEILDELKAITLAVKELHGQELVNGQTLVALTCIIILQALAFFFGSLLHR